MEKWFIASKRADFNKIGEIFHISPVTARLMRNRSLTTVREMQRYLYGSLSDLYDSHLLKDADKGAEIIKEKIETGKKIRIISDYDVDGVSSNYILYQGLKRCGADVDYKIPDRVEDGYGINEHLIEKAAEDGIDTIITCDNGIAAAEQIAYGNSLGLTLIFRFKGKKMEAFLIICRQPLPLLIRSKKIVRIHLKIYAERLLSTSLFRCFMICLELTVEKVKYFLRLRRWQQSVTLCHCVMRTVLS